MVTEKQAYEWVKTGHWTLAEFTAWVTSVSGAAWSEGHEEGWLEGYNSGYDCGRND